MSFQARRTVASDHPALVGHFPGNPIVPGVLILDEVLQAARQWRGQLLLRRVVSLKFTSTLKPDNAFDINLSEDGSSHIEFECLLGGSKFASGRLEVEFDANGP